jgi:hypothetical protein
MIEDTDNPTRPEEYRSGFFRSDFRAMSDRDFAALVSPGDVYYRALFTVNADGSRTDINERNNAVTQWNALTTCQRWAIRLHNEALIRKIQDTKIFVYYHTGLVNTKLPAITQCKQELEYLGATFAEMQTTLDADVPGSSAVIWPRVDLVIAGWESDFGL